MSYLGGNRYKSFIWYFVLIMYIFGSFHISYTIPILVNVKESLQGFFPYFNTSINGNVVSITGVWENVGSVTCDTYLRLKINTSSKLKDFWSEKVNVPPGGSGTLKVFAYLNNTDEKNITILPYFYYCNEIERLKPISLLNYNTTKKYAFTSYNHTNVSFTLDDKNKATILMTNLSNISEIYIIPESPEGWILPSKKVEVKNNSIKMNYLFYRPENSACCAKVMFIFKDYRGRYFVANKKINFTFVSHNFSRKVDWRIYGFYVMSSISLFLLLLICFMIKNIKKSNR